MQGRLGCQAVRGAEAAAAAFESHRCQPATHSCITWMRTCFNPCRADWAAKLCVELERQELGWYDAGELLGSVAGWGDRSYSITIENFMREARRGGNGPPPPQQGR